MESGKNTKVTGLKSCPLCGAAKYPQHIVCKGCNDKYKSAAAKALANDGRDLRIGEWLREALAEKVAILSADLEAQRQDVRDLTEEVAQDAYRAVTGGLKRKVEKDVLFSALDLKKKALWNERGGNTLYGQMRALESRVTWIKAFLAEKPSQTTVAPVANEQAA